MRCSHDDPGSRRRQHGPGLQTSRHPPGPAPARSEILFLYLLLYSDFEDIEAGLQQRLLLFVVLPGRCSEVQWWRVMMTATLHFTGDTARPLP